MSRFIKILITKNKIIMGEKQSKKFKKETLIIQRIKNQLVKQNPPKMMIKVWILLSKIVRNRKTNKK